MRKQRAPDKTIRWLLLVFRFHPYATRDTTVYQDRLGTNIGNVQKVTQNTRHAADVNGTTPRRDGCTPVLAAAAAGDIAMVTQLCESGADMGACERHGISALAIATARVEQVRVRCFLSTFCRRMIILPRQARDKHGPREGGHSKKNGFLIETPG